MARHVKRLWDEERTALLDQRELFVEKGKGGPDYFLAWLQAPEMDACPFCAGGVIKIHDVVSKIYFYFFQSFLQKMGFIPIILCCDTVCRYLWHRGR